VAESHIPVLADDRWHFIQVSVVPKAPKLVNLTAFPGWRRRGLSSTLERRLVEFNTTRGRDTPSSKSPTSSVKSPNNSSAGGNGRFGARSEEDAEQASFGAFLAEMAHMIRMEETDAMMPDPNHSKQNRATSSGGINLGAIKDPEANDLVANSASVRSSNVTIRLCVDGKDINMTHHTRRHDYKNVRKEEMRLKRVLHRMERQYESLEKAILKSEAAHEQQLSSQSHNAGKSTMGKFTFGSQKPLSSSSPARPDSAASDGSANNPFSVFGCPVEETPDDDNQRAANDNASAVDALQSSTKALQRLEQQRFRRQVEYYRVKQLHRIFLLSGDFTSKGVVGRNLYPAPDLIGARNRQVAVGGISAQEELKRQIAHRFFRDAMHGGGRAGAGQFTSNGGIVEEKEVERVALAAFRDLQRLKGLRRKKEGVDATNKDIDDNNEDDVMYVDGGEKFGAAEDDIATLKRLATEALSQTDELNTFSEEYLWTALGLGNSDPSKPSTRAAAHQIQSTPKFAQPALLTNFFCGRIADVQVTDNGVSADLAEITHAISTSIRDKELRLLYVQQGDVENNNASQAFSTTKSATFAAGTDDPNAGASAQQHAGDDDDEFGNGVGRLSFDGDSVRMGGSIRGSFRKNAVTGKRAPSFSTTSKKAAGKRNGRKMISFQNGQEDDEAKRVAALQPPKLRFGLLSGLLPPMSLAESVGFGKETFRGCDGASASALWGGGVDAAVKKVFDSNSRSRYLRKGHLAISTMLRNAAGSASYLTAKTLQGIAVGGLSSYERGPRWRAF
jgi:hypothetical protein